MAVTLNFRSALGGFHREDVVHYIEYMQAKHASQISQLTTEAEELRRQLDAVTAVPDLTDEVAELKAKLEALEAENTELKAQRDAAVAELDKVKAEQTQTAEKLLETMELEAYRRAEQVERNAKARAEQIYHQATGTLAQATLQVDAAANAFRDIAEQVNQQMAELQVAVDSSKAALQDAAATMYAICPTEPAAPAESEETEE